MQTDKRRNNSPILLNPISFREVSVRNRIALSPMCQYSATDGMPDDWHFAHLAARAVGGAGIVFTEATHIEPRGRITPFCLGLWNTDQSERFARIVQFIERQGAVPGIQLGHAGRKASTSQPWEGSRPLGSSEGGWDTIAPSSLPFAEDYPSPQPVSERDIEAITQSMARSVALARRAGFKVVEVHAAHGYLINQFLSPLSNTRTDRYGGPFENRIRFLLEMIDAARSEWPDSLPLFVRLSVSEWVAGGWDVADSIELAKILKAGGKVDLIDCSSGGNDPRQKISVHPGYQLPFAEAVRKGADIATGAVGLLQSPDLCEQALANGQADIVFLGRAMLADPNWPIKAAKALGAGADWPIQYARADIL